MPITLHSDKPFTTPISIEAGTSDTISAILSGIDLSDKTAQIRLREFGKLEYHLTQTATISSSTVSYGLTAIETGIPGKYEMIFVILDSTGKSVAKYPGGRNGWMLEITGVPYEDTETKLAAATAAAAAADEARDQALAGALSVEMNVLVDFVTDVNTLPKLPTVVADNKREFVWTGVGWQLYEYDLAGDAWAKIGGLIGGDLASTIITAPTDSVNASILKRYVVLDAGKATGTFVLNPSGLLVNVDNATILQASTGTWDRIYDGPMYAEWFGVVGDEITDDTTNMKAAFTAAYKAQKTLGLSSKSTGYLVTGNVFDDATTQFNPKFSLVGHGKASAKFLFNATNPTDKLFHFKDVDFVEMRNIWISGVGGTDGLAVVIGDQANDKSANRGLFNNVKINDVGTCIKFEQGWIWDFTDCQIGRATNYGYHFDMGASTFGANQVSIRGGLVEGDGTGVGIYTAPSTKITSFSVANSTIEGWATGGVEIHSTTGLAVSIVDCYFESNGTKHISVGENALDDIEALYIKRCFSSGDAPIVVDRVKYYDVDHIANDNGWGSVQFTSNAGRGKYFPGGGSNATTVAFDGVVQSGVNKTSIAPVFATKFEEIATASFPLVSGTYTKLDILAKWEVLAQNFQITEVTGNDVTGKRALRAGGGGSPGGFELHINRDGNTTWFSENLNSRKICFRFRKKNGANAAYGVQVSSRVQYNDGALQTAFPSALSVASATANMLHEGNWVNQDYQIDLSPYYDAAGFLYIDNIFINIRAINTGAATANDIVDIDWIEVYNSEFGPTDPLADSFEQRHSGLISPNQAIIGALKIDSASQTTVGAAGGASALPATPSRYITVYDEIGNKYVFPVYLAS